MRHRSKAAKLMQREGLVMAEETRRGQPEQIDIKSLTPEDIDRLGHEQLREALKSVVRPPPGMMHKDHRSHSNV